MPTMMQSQVKVQIMQNVFEEIQSKMLEPNEYSNKPLLIRIIK